MFKTSDRASFLIILFRLFQYYVFVVLSGDVFFTFSISNFVATASPEQKIAHQTFFALKDRLAIICRLLCLVAQIFWLIFLTGLK